MVQFVAPDARSDASGVARAFALEVAKTALKGVWLLELDLLNGAQHRYFENRQDRYGPLSAPARASPGEALHFTVSSPEGHGASAGTDYFYAQAVGGLRLWVTRFRTEALRPGQSVKILADGAYYEALRPHADYVVVDAPPLDRSTAARAAAPFMDDNLLVLSAETPSPLAALRLKEELLAAGGRCAGIVLTDAPKDPPSFLKRLLAR